MEGLITTLLTAIVPSAVAALITFLTIGRKYRAEVKTVEEHNAQAISETCKPALDDLNLRPEKYILENRRREENFPERAVDYLKKIKEADGRICKPEQKIRFLIRQTCVKRGCNERTRIENENGDIHTHFVTNRR